MCKYSYWIMFYTLLRKEVTRVLRIWTQTLIPSAINISLYFLIFGTVVGKKIGLMNGVNYLNFITPGLLIMAVINNSYSNVVSSFFGSRFNRSIEEILVSPITTHILIIGFISGGIFRGLVVGCSVAIVAGVFGAYDILLLNIYLVLFGFFLCSILFSLGGLINGIFSRNFDDISIFPTFILTPLIYLGGIFYSLDSLPLFWQKIVYFNPMFYIIELSRFSFLGSSSISPLKSFIIIITCIVTLYFFSYYLISKGIRLKN